MKWTEEQTQALIRLHKEDKYFLSEIANQMGLHHARVRFQARKLGLKNSDSIKARLGEWNKKHQHLREPVMAYFVNHTIRETCEHFGLTLTEFKSIFTVGYRDPKLKHLRKDNRRKDKWSEKECVFLIQHSGIKPRDWIARKLKRGTRESTKECLSRLKTTSRYLNGLPERLANLIIRSEGIKTSAGAPGPGGDCHIRIVPWVALEDQIKGKRIKRDVRIAIRALARFQRWMHSAQSNKEVIKTIKGIARGK